ncbi:MAG: hypothetical protein Q7T36_08910 [Fluviicoccus sp.]|uniref:hypothetical protein n=1 Tax=Fluviicoccus sp. TaxID=2003552 RepID=UPI00271A7917|nr:hypothetical protein [Fluviicoccus sp.]MDO8330576.1 hypothetical protein [Fluviicoccus sp.]
MNDKLTPDEAMVAMHSFLEMYWERGHSEEIACLLSSLILQEDGSCADPALSGDWEQCVQRVINTRPQSSPVSISQIHWHDCVVVACIELPEKDQLVLTVEYPEDWERNQFSKRSIVFTGFHQMTINEIPFDGCPTILSAATTEQSDGYIGIRLETNAGYREITAKSVALMSEWLTA